VFHVGIREPVSWGLLTHHARPCPRIGIVCTKVLGKYFCPPSQAKVRACPRLLDHGLWNLRADDGVCEIVQMDLRAATKN
jgi:hypothetical protein